MTLQRHTGTHIALPPIADVPLAPEAEKNSEPAPKTSETGEPLTGKPCQAEGGTQD
jgi:hypothetical protein